MLNLPSYAKIYLPSKVQPIIGSIQIIHDMAEHQGRYTAFAQYMSSNGYAVITSDLKGHGTHIKREAEIGYIGDNAVSNFVGDTHELTRMFKSICPDVPYFLIGHGMGALVALSYFKKYDYFVDGLFLSGMPSDGSKSVDKLSCTVKAALKGEYYRSRSLYKTLYACNFGFFNHESQATAWLSSDPDVCHSFEKDPKCGFTYTINGYRAYIDLLDSAYKNGSWIRKNLDVPIRIIAGAKDTVAGSKHKLSKIASHFKAYGYTDIETQLFADMRHDIYNDTGYEQAYSYILGDMDRICSKNHQNM